MSTSSSRQSPGCVMLALKLLAVYLLSHGPVQALYSSERLQGPVPNAVTVFYEPLHWLYDHTPLGTPMTAYDGWWQHILKKACPSHTPWCVCPIGGEDEIPCATSACRTLKKVGLYPMAAARGPGDTLLRSHSTSARL